MILYLSFPLLLCQPVCCPQSNGGLTIIPTKVSSRYVLIDVCILWSFTCICLWSGHTVILYKTCNFAGSPMAPHCGPCSLQACTKENFFCHGDCLPIGVELYAIGQL